MGEPVVRYAGEDLTKHGDRVDPPACGYQFTAEKDWGIERRRIKIQFATERGGGFLMSAQFAQRTRLSEVSVTVVAVHLGDLAAHGDRVFISSARLKAEGESDV